MNLIQWRDEFSVGIESIDHDHKELIALINGLHEDMQANATREDVIESLGRIHAQFSAHFALEEKIMREAGYRSYPEHKLDHETLLDELEEIMNSIGEDAQFPDAELSQDLDRWFSDHFHIHDAKLHKALPHG